MRKGETLVGDALSRFLCNVNRIPQSKGGGNKKTSPKATDNNRYAGSFVKRNRRRIIVGREDKSALNTFIQPSGNKSYSKEFKIKCIKTVLRGELSIPDCVATHGISNDSILRHWISEYNANRELKDYDPKREVYMAEARRKTTIEERKEIVKYCIEHGRDYKGTASLYDVSYTQVYSWVRKYVADGEDALIDKRGHHKTDDEVDELERLRRENTRLKRQLEEKDMLVTLLKKVKELEGM